VSHPNGAYRGAHGEVSTGAAVTSYQGVDVLTLAD
jgi:hypothetical protein